MLPYIRFWIWIACLVNFVHHKNVTRLIFSCHRSNSALATVWPYTIEIFVSHISYLWPVPGPWPCDKSLGPGLVTSPWALALCQMPAPWPCVKCMAMALCQMPGHGLVTSPWALALCQMPGHGLVTSPWAWPCVKCLALWRGVRPCMKQRETARGNTGSCHPWTLSTLLLPSFASEQVYILIQR